MSYPFVARSSAGLFAGPDNAVFSNYFILVIIVVKAVKNAITHMIQVALLKWEKPH